MGNLLDSRETSSFHGPAEPSAGPTLQIWSQKPQSEVMPASLTTLAHSATSDVMISANVRSGALFGSQPATSSLC